MPTLQLARIAYLVKSIDLSLIHTTLLTSVLKLHSIKPSQRWHTVQVYISVQNNKKDCQWTAIDKTLHELREKELQHGAGGH